MALRNHSSLTRGIKPGSLAVKACSPNHWTTPEVSVLFDCEITHTLYRIFEKIEKNGIGHLF